MPQVAQQSMALAVSVTVAVTALLLSAALVTVAGQVGEVHGCTRDEELQSLVHAPGTRTIMYVMCHNAQSATIARNVTACWGNWVQLVQLGQSPFFESYAYRSTFPYLAGDWPQYDYVVTATYKTLSHPIGKTILVNPESIKQAIGVLQKGQHHVYPFLRSKDDSRYWGEKYHGHLYSVAWDTVLEAQGFNASVIHSFDHKGVFYRNIYVSTTAAFAQLVQRMDQGIALVETVPAVRKTFEIDSGYSFADPVLAKQIYNHTNYHMHPFVFERLPAFYLHAHGFEVCTNHPDCPPNS